MRPDQNDDLIGRTETATKAGLDSLFRGAVREFRPEVVSIIEIEVDGRQRLPSLHPAVRPDVVITVEDDVCLAAIGYSAEHQPLP